MSYLRINSIMKNPSLCDGYGYRTVVFLQGCNLHCPGCHNKSTWALDKGTLIEVSKLAQFLREKAINKKVTISGGEPLLQKEALLELLEELKFKNTDIQGYIDNNPDSFIEINLKEFWTDIIEKSKKEVYSALKQLLFSL